MAVHADGSPVWIRNGPNKLRANRPDVHRSPPPTSNEIEALEAAVAKASKALKSATTKAGKIEPEKIAATGYEVFRGPQRISGVVYSPGDPFDPSSVNPDRLNLLIDRRIIRRVGRLRQ